MQPNTIATPASTTTASASSPPNIKTQMTRLEVLMGDPVVLCFRDRPRPPGMTLGEAKLLDRRAILLVARAIVSTLLAEGAAALEFGRALLQVCFRRDGVQLGESLCNMIFDRALDEVTTAAKIGSRPQKAVLSTSYEVFRRHGVPSHVCSAGLRVATNPAERARILAKEAQPDFEQLLVEAAEASDDFERRCIFDSTANRWLIQSEYGEWTGPFTPDAFKTLLSQNGIPVGVAQSRFISGCRDFCRADILPGVQADLLKIDGVGVRNLFRPTDVEPEPGPFPDIAKTFINIADGNWGFLNYLFDWLSLLLQSLYPNLSRRGRGWNAGQQAEIIQSQVAIVLAGAQGAGKDTVGAITAALFGSANGFVLDQNALDSRFKGQLRSALFLYCNEAMSSTNRSAETANFLKSVIAGDKLVLEEKYKTTETVVARMNVVVASNDDCPVIIEKTDRRYSVKRSSRRLAVEVGGRVWADLKGPRSQLAAFFDFLLNRRTRIAPGFLYDTPERRLMQQTMSHSEEKFVEAIADEGWLAVSLPWVYAAPGQQIREAVAPSASTLVPSHILNEVYQYWCRENGWKPRGSTKLGQAVKTLPGVKATTTQYRHIKMRCYGGLPLHGPPVVQVVSPLPATAVPPALAATAAVAAGAQIPLSHLNQVSGQ